MKEIIKKLTRGIKLNRDYLEQVKKSIQTLEYMNSLDFESMPDEIKEMNRSIINRAQEVLEEKNNDIVLYEENYEDEECGKYADSFSEIGEMSEIYYDLKCLDSILKTDEIEITENINTQLNDLIEEWNDKFEELKADLRLHIENAVKEELFKNSPQEKKKEQNAEQKQVRKPSQRNYIVRKSNKSLQEIKEIIDEYIRINEQIFNKIIFESKPSTLSVADRVLDVYFKPGTGYVVNFISEPDTNYGKFYRNLLNVFNEIREYVYDNYEIVISPEDGKSISYLNSFYQNYIFVREKIDTALTQFKLQNSLLNENFSVKYMIFEKISGKYLVFFNGNKDLSKAVEQYFVNQAKLGTMQFEIEFVEYEGDIRKIVIGRLDKIRNRIDLSGENNYLKLSRVDTEDKAETLLFDVTGVKILVDPESEYKGNDIDIVVMTNARNAHTNIIPKIMSKNPSAKLFTSDISFKIAKVKWLRELNNPNLLPGSSENIEFTRRDIEGLNDRVIRITPMGKGYNYRNLVNIKFFSSGALPGAAIVEIRDANYKTIYLGVHSKDDTFLLTGTENDLSEYDFIYSSSRFSYPYLPLNVDLIKNKLSEEKQVFIFTDSLGNLQHAVTELYSAGITKPMVSGDVSFDITNKEISKLLNFGSSWGDNFIDRELFSKSVSKMEPFTDEYEFYKKFSTNESLIFFLPFDKMELEMVIKNKFYADNLIFIPSDYEKEFVNIVEKDPVIPDEFKSGKHITYNYIRNTGPAEVYNSCKDHKQFKKLISESEIEGVPSNKLIIVESNSEKRIYG